MALGMLLIGHGAAARAWPTRPVKAIVPFAAGSAVDIVARQVFEQLSTQLGQAVVVENRAGAGGTIAAALVAKADADGYTLLVATSAHTIAPALQVNPGYDPARDFAAVVPLGATPFVLVVPPGRGFKTARELIVAGQVRPGAFNFASVGEGSASHLSAERFRLSAGLQAVHVPFKGGPEAMTEVMSGRIDFFFVALGAALPQIRDSRLTALAVNGATRARALPAVPTLREAGFDDAEYPTWFGLFLPARTPRDIVDQLQRETLEALRHPQVRDKLEALGVEPLAMSSNEFAAHVEKEMAVNAALVAAIGLRAK